MRVSTLMLIGGPAVVLGQSPIYGQCKLPPYREIGRERYADLVFTQAAVKDGVVPHLVSQARYAL